MALTHQHRQADPAETGTAGPTDGATIPAQRMPQDPVTADHVRRHGNRCYWDVAECRWVCTR